MKKQHLSLITLALVASIMMGCKASSTKAQAANDIKEAQAADTLVVNKDSCILQEGKIVQCTISVDYPTEPNELSKNIRAILNEELANLYLGNMNGDEIEKQESYKGDLANGNLVIEKYCKDNFAYLKSQMKDLKEADPRANANMSYDIRLNKEAETDSYVTYHCLSYAYLAGAHGSTFERSFNIVKATGKKLSQVVDTARVKDLQPILRKGVLSYLNQHSGNESQTANEEKTGNEGQNENEEQITDAQLNDYLFIENGIIPLPSSSPYLAKDGVHFIYQQYEIGPYAMGLVSFTVPLDKIKPYLTAEALKLLK